MNEVDWRKDLKDSIEKMSRYHQIEVLRLMVKDEIYINENQNGSFINLTHIPHEKLLTVKKYVSYVNEQETNLHIIESEKDRIQNVFFKDNKDDTCHKFNNG